MTGYPTLRNDWEIQPDERLDDLQNHGLKILQKTTGFRFGMDSILLKDFVRLKPRDSVADLGTGSAVLPILLSQKESSVQFTAFEWQKEIAAMAARSVRCNQLSHRITIYHEDLRNAWRIAGKASMSVVVCNPPYGKKNGVLLNENENKQLSKHETECSIDEIISAAAKLLKSKGRLYLVFPSYRMLELFDCMRKYQIEPKQVRMVCAKASKAPYILLVEGIKNAKPMLHFQSPLIVYHEDGTETDELKCIYLSQP